MYVIVVYDIQQERVNKVCRLLRRYLHWVQNSAFEGEITEAKFERLKNEIRKIINEEEDSVYFYLLSDEKWLKKQTLGRSKGSTKNIL